MHHALQSGRSSERKACTLVLGLPKENVIIGKLIPAGTGLPARREQLDWMPKPRPLAVIFGEEEETVPALPPEEELSLEDLEDEEEDEELEELEEGAEPSATEIKESGAKQPFLTKRASESRSFDRLSACTAHPVRVSSPTPRRRAPLYAMLVAGAVSSTGNSIALIATSPRSGRSVADAARRRGLDPASAMRRMSSSFEVTRASPRRMAPSATRRSLRVRRFAFLAKELGSKIGTVRPHDRSHLRGYPHLCEELRIPQWFENGSPQLRLKVDLADETVIELEP